MDSKQERQVESDIALMEAVGFSVEDINANRKGGFTKTQQKILSQERSVWRFYTVIVLLAVPVLIILAILDGIDRRDTFSSRIGIIALIIILAGVLFFYCHAKWKQFRADLLENRVSSVEGVADLKSYPRRNGREYVVVMEKMQFKISRLTFETFKAGSKYRIYYAQHSKWIMSAEPVAS